MPSFLSGFEFLGARGKPSQRERLRCLLSLLAFVGKWVNDGRGKSDS